MWQDSWTDRKIPEDEWPLVDEEHPLWRIRILTRDAAEDNRLQKMFRVWVKDRNGNLMPGIKIRVDVEPSNTGTAYDHLNVWQYTGGAKGREGYWEWEHLGEKSPTRYFLWMENDERPLIERLRTDLGMEYPKDDWGNYTSWRPGCKPGVYSYRIEIYER